MSATRHPALLSWLHLVRIYHKMHRQEQELLGAYHLTLPQFEALEQLSRGQGITQQQLAERLLVTKGNICGIIDRLSERELVERRTNPNDRRANCLYLTASGEALAREVAPIHQQLIESRMEALNASDQRILHTLLRQLDRSIHTE